MIFKGKESLMEKSLVHIILFFISMELQTYPTFQLYSEMTLHRVFRMTMCSLQMQHDRTIFHCRRKIHIAYLPNLATLTKAETFPCLGAGLRFFDGGRSKRGISTKIGPSNYNQCAG